MLVLISIMFICIFLFDLDGVYKILDEEYLLLFSIKGTESIVVKNVKEDIPQMFLRGERAAEKRKANKILPLWFIVFRLILTRNTGKYKYLKKELRTKVLWEV